MTKSPSKDKREVTEQDIRARAYEIYLSRNGSEGDAYNDWLQAEQELKADE
jgi:hypothetical protein